MNAKQAKEVSDAVNKNKSERQRAYVYAQIENAAKSGKFEYFFYEILYPVVKQSLQDDGYVVFEHFDQREGQCTKISW